MNEHFISAASSNSQGAIVVPVDPQDEFECDSCQ